MWIKNLCPSLHQRNTQTKYTKILPTPPPPPGNYLLYGTYVSVIHKSIPCTCSATGSDHSLVTNQYFERCKLDTVSVDYTSRVRGGGKVRPHKSNRLNIDAGGRIFIYLLQKFTNRFCRVSNYHDQFVGSKEKIFFVGS